MSRTTAQPPPGRRLPAGLLRNLIDDAAVFPPGSAALSDAVADYRRRRESDLADYIGPLLVPVAGAAELAALVTARAHDGAALPVTLIARPGVDPGAVGTALEVLGIENGGPGHSDSARAQDLEGPPRHEGPQRRGGYLGLNGRLRVVGVELARQEGWRSMVPDLPVAVEVPRGPAGYDGLAELAGQKNDRRAPKRNSSARPTTSPSQPALAGDARSGALGVRAKLRTQSTANDSVPTAQELGDFIGTCARLGLGFKLTGGLHRALAHTVQADPVTPGSAGAPATPAHAGAASGSESLAGTEEQHGVLNVMLATHLALSGATHEELVRALELRDAEAVAGPLLDLSADQVSALRASFTSFGCCGVTDPLRDLAGLGLIDLD